jgi:FdhD protein
MGRLTRGYRVRRLRGGEWSERPDTLVVEEPLEIRVGGHPYAVTMRTPGHDFDLAAGFLVSEGVVGRPNEISTIRYCSDESPCGQLATTALARLTASHEGHPHSIGPREDALQILGDRVGGTLSRGVGTGAEGPGGTPEEYEPPQVTAALSDSTYNIVDVTLAPGVTQPRPEIERSVYTTSSCGVCGKTALDAVQTTTRWPVGDDPMLVHAATIGSLPDSLRAEQRVFARTGGLHAAGIFTAEGALVCLREDVGRHNAVDKVMGWALRTGGLPLSGHILQVSGRASFELVQKAVMAGMPMLTAVSAPSSLAVDLAAEAGLTLVGFVRDRGMCVYAHRHRVIA